MNFSETVDYIYNLTRSGIKLWIQNDRLNVVTPQGVQLSDNEKQFINTNKENLIDILKRNRVFSERYSCLVLKNEEENGVLSFGQERLYFIDQFEEGTNAYNIPLIFRLNPDRLFNLEAFENSIQALIGRHEILRTLLKEDHKGALYQCVLKEIEIPRILRDVPVTTQDELDQKIGEEVNYVFDLSSDYPIRVCIYEYGQDIYVSFVIHHIAFDGWSVDIFLREFESFYLHYSEHIALELPELSLQYKDFALWQRSYLQGKHLEEQSQYWQRSLEGYETIGLIPDRPRPKQFQYEGRDLSFEIDEIQSIALRELARRSGSTINTVLLAAYFLMLRVYSHQDDLVLGTPLLNRHYSHTENLIGFFVNSLPIRVQIDTNDRVIDYIRKVNQKVIEAQLYQDFPFERLVEELHVPHDPSIHPIFQVMFAVQNFGNDQKNRLFEKYEPKRECYNIAKFDLSTFIDDSGSLLKGVFNYATKIYDSTTIAGYIKTYLKITKQLAQMVSSTAELENLRVADLTYLEDDDYSKIVYQWNRTDRKNSGKSVNQMFEEQVINRPDAIAVSCGYESLTYLELSRKIERLSSYFYHTYALQPEDLVFLILERNIDYLAVMLAIFKLGAAFVPIDPTMPRERILSIIEECRVKLVLTDRKNSLLSHDYQMYFPNICIVDDLPQIPYEPVQPVSLNKAIAYIFYTSGSTGKPKGAMIEYEGMINHLLSKIEDLKITSEDHVAQIASQSFDVSVWQFLSAVLVGGRTVVFPGDTAWDPDPLLRICCQEKVTILQTVPSHMHPILSEIAVDPNRKTHSLESLRWLILNGEPLPHAMCDRWFEFYPDIPIMNAYGATEVSDDVCHYVITKSSCRDAEYYNGVMPVGGLVRNSTLFVLDSCLHPLPVRAVGEIYLGGIGVGRGYYKRSDLTAERFIGNPFNDGKDQEGFSSAQHLRLYKTGDLGRYLSDGRIEFCGRVDFQVKIRGQRVELEEIEKAIEQLQQIKQAVVIPRKRASGDESSGDKYLVAYYISDEPLDQNWMIQQLSDKLPEHMIPKIFMYLKSFPLTVSGKLDRKSLPEPVFQENKTYAPPRNDFEIQLTHIWSEILGVDIQCIGINDDFFRLGGDSIISIQLANRIRKRLEVSVSVKDIFTYRTIGTLAQHLSYSKGLSLTIPQAEQGLLSGSFPLLPIQEWFFNSRFPEEGHWNQSFLLRVPPLDVDRLCWCIEKILAHHDALRLRFQHASDQSSTSIFQCYETLDKFVVNELFEELDVSLLTYDEQQKKMSDWQSNFDISNGPLLKIGYLYGYPDGSVRLFFAFHHLIIDAVSWRIFIEDLRTLYEGYTLGAKGTSYRQWVENMHRYTEQYPREAIYWNDIQSDYEDGPFNLSRIVPDVGPMQRADFTLSADKTERLLRNCHTAFHTSIPDVLLSVLAYVLQDLTNQTSNYVLLEGHGREHLSPNIDLSKTIGWFTSLYPLLIDAKSDIGMTVKYVKEKMKSIPNKGLGYGPHVGYQNPDNLPKVVFNYLGQFNDKEEKNWEIAWEDAGISVHPANVSPNLLTINSFVAEGKLQFEVMSRLEKYAPDYIANRFLHHLEVVVSYLCSFERSYLTPSDVEFVVNQEYLDKIQVESDIEDIYLANSLQQGFVYRYLNSNAENDAYCVQLIWQYRQSINVDVYRKAWELAQRRFDVLRLRLAWDEEIVQVIAKDSNLDWRFIDMSSEIDKLAQEQRIKEIQVSDRKKRYHPDKAPLFRLYLIKCHETLYTMIFSNHHAILDGWSNPILLKFVHETYFRLMKGEYIQINRDETYGSAQRYLQTHYHESISYWKERLSSISEAHYIVPKLNQSFNYSRSKTSISTKQNCLKIEGELYQGIKQLVNNHGFTINAVLQYVWHRILHIFTRLDTTIVGSTVSGRNLPVGGIEDAVGLFINTLPLIVDHKRHPQSLLDAINDIQTAIAEINTYANIHLSHLQKNGGQLFDTIFIFENYPVPDDDGDQTLSTVFLEAVEKLDYPLAIMAYEAGLYIEIIWKYDESHINDSYIQQWTIVFEQLLRQLVLKPMADPETLEYLTAEETKALINQNFSREFYYPKGKTIHELFEQQALEQPEAIALVCGTNAMSYQELNQKANQLAYHIKELVDLAPDDCIALCMERSEMLVVSLLAILKAGAAYVPLDPNYPDLRICQILEETKAKIMITDRVDKFDSLSMEDMPRMVDLRCVDKQIQHYPKNNLPIAFTKVSENHLAYIIYTSGTTGSPKGVMIEHRSFIATLYAFKVRHFSNIHHLNTYSLTSMMFDIFGLEYGLPLLTGGTVTIGLNPVLEWLDCSHYHFIQMTPYLCEANLDQLVNTEKLVLLVGGEALPSKLLEKICSKKINLINVYGPTETTIWSTSMPYFFDQSKEFQKQELLVKIGSPLPGEITYVLDHQLKLLPALAIGELYIGGTGLARGYLNKPEQTKQKFLADPYQNNSRIYKTGDLVRRHPDGHLEYIGRVDQQIKLRGQRIELSEIENAINQYSGIEQNTVILKHNSKEEPSLICYYTTTDGMFRPDEEIKRFLFTTIPSYMVPTAYVHLDKFPLNTSGKLDRNKLPDVTLKKHYEYSQQARNPLEKQVKTIWEEILGLRDLDIRDDFFKLGGNSILAIKLINKINKQYFTNLKLADIFVHNTIESFVPRIDQLKEGPQIIHKLNDAEFNPKMFMIHPGGGGCEVYLPLAKKLQSDFSCYGVDYYNLYHEEKIGAVKDIALFYLSEMDKVIDTSASDLEAVHLLGWSFGGQIALEMAYQLEMRGRKNIQVYALDTILSDNYLESLGSYEDLEKRKELFANYATAQGYNQAYVEQVKANIHMESILGMQRISGMLKSTHVVLFKAMMEDKTISEVMSRHHEINQYVEKLEYNNIEKIIACHENIVLYQVLNTDHGSLLEQQDFLIPRIITHKFDRRLL